MKRLIIIYKSLFILGILCLLMVKHVFAQDGATVSILKDTIVIGDQIPLDLQLKLNEMPDSVYFPEISDTFNKIEVISRADIDTQIIGQNIILKQRLIITSFDSGRYEIPSFLFRYKDSRGNTQNEMSQSIFLNVNTISVDTTKDFKPINDIFDEEAPDFWTQVKDSFSKYKLYYLLGIALLLLLIAYLFWRRLHNKKGQSKVISYEPPFAKALRLLNELDRQKEWEQGNYKSYYTRLSDIIRDYLDESYQFNANELTTRDLLKKVKKSRELRTIHQELKLLLNTSDLAKFAKTNPTEDQRLASFLAAHKIVNQTKPKVEVRDDQ